MELFDAAGTARRLRASPLFAIGPSEPGPALHRGALVAIPVGAALLLELGLDSPSKGAIGTGALLAGFAALDAPARVRGAWQAAVAPLIGIAAALGVLTGSSPLLAALTLGAIGAAAGYGFSVSLRFAIAGLSVTLSLLIAQGLPLELSDALPALLLSTAGGLGQAAFSLAVWVWEETCRRLEADIGAQETARPRGTAWDWSGGVEDLRSNFTLASLSARHAIRFGIALALGVAAYWLLGMHEHGFWIPLTVLFVMRPEESETFNRLVLRAVGTVAGLVLATALSFWLHDHGVALAIALAVATALAYGLLTVQYALFTTAITTYAVLLADSLGEPALDAAGQRGLATAIGIAIAGLAFLAWPNPRSGEEPGEGPPLVSPPAAR